MERRFITSREIRASGSGDGGLRIEGYASVFNKPTTIQTKDGSFREQVKPGAFTRALNQKQDVVCLFNHNDNYVLGRTSAGTLSLRQDDHGLFYTCDLPNTQAGRDTHASIKRNDIQGCSFAFSVTDDGQDWSMDERSGMVCRDIRNVNELIDVSPCTHPAYEGTAVSARNLETLIAEIRSGKLRRQPPYVSPEKVLETLQGGQSFEEQTEDIRAARNRRLRLL
jgi:HK97 family phage prohead protease